MGARIATDQYSMDDYPDNERRAAYRADLRAINHQTAHRGTAAAQKHRGLNCLKHNFGWGVDVYWVFKTI